MIREKDKYIDMDIADAILERPQTFELNGVRYRIYPPTYGHKVLIDRYIEQLGFDEDKAQYNAISEALRVCNERKECVARILTLHTLKGKEEVLDNELVEDRAKVFCEDMTVQELATLLILVLTMFRIDPFLKRFGLDKEHENLSRVRKCKKMKNTYVFNGKTAYGTLIDYACERYGWTMDYVVWGISYQNLSMLMQDAVTQIYLDDEEKKKCHVPMAVGEVINGDDPKNADYLKELLKD